MRTKKDIFLTSLSLVSLLFYLSYSVFLGLHYKLSEEVFLSFSLLGFLGLGLAGILRLPSLAMASIAVASPQTIAWVVDVVGLALFKHSLLGSAEGRFQPGLSLWEFYLSFYPLFLIPLAITLPRHLPKPKKTPYLLTGLLVGAVLLISRFLFSGQSDPNCSRLSCLDLFSRMPVTAYPWSYLLFYTAVSLFLVKIITLYFEIDKTSFPLTRYPKTTLVIYCLFSLVLMANDTKNFKSIPRFSCDTLPSKGSVEMQCAYTLEYSPGFFSLFFLTTNRSESTQHCNLYLSYKDTRESMYQAVLIRPGKQLKLSVVLPYPENPSGSKVFLSSECEK